MNRWLERLKYLPAQSGCSNLGDELLASTAAFGSRSAGLRGISSRYFLWRRSAVVEVDDDDLTL
jgi:hypothetical protein